MERSPVTRLTYACEDRLLANAFDMIPAHHDAERQGRARVLAGRVTSGGIAGSSTGETDTARQESSPTD